MELIAYMKKELDRLREENLQLREEVQVWKKRAEDVYAVLQQLEADIRNGEFIKAQRMRLVKEEE